MTGLPGDSRTVLRQTEANPGLQSFAVGWRAIPYRPISGFHLID